MVAVLQQSLAWLPHVRSQDSQEVVAGVPWEGLGVTSCHKLFELNVGNISLVSGWRPSPSRAASWEQEMTIWKIDGGWGLWGARLRHQSLIRLVLILTAFK